MTTVLAICLLTRLTARNSFSGILKPCILRSHFRFKTLTTRQNFLVATSFKVHLTDASKKMSSELMETSEYKKLSTDVNSEYDNSDGEHEKSPSKRDPSKDSKCRLEPRDWQDMKDEGDKGCSSDYTHQSRGSFDNMKKFKEQKNYCDDKSDKEDEKSTKKRHQSKEKSEKQKNGKDDRSDEENNISHNKREHGKTHSTKEKYDRNDNGEYKHKKHSNKRDDTMENSTIRKNDSDTGSDAKQNTSLSKRDRSRENSTKRKHDSDDDSEQDQKKSPKKKKKKRHHEKSEKVHKKSSDHSPQNEETRNEKRSSSKSPSKIKRLREDSEMKSGHSVLKSNERTCENNKGKNVQEEKRFKKQSSMQTFLQSGKSGDSFNRSPKSSYSKGPVNSYSKSQGLSSNSRPGESFQKSQLASSSRGHIQRNFSTSGKTFKNEKKTPKILLREYKQSLTKQQNLHDYDKIKYQDSSQDKPKDFEYFFGSNGPFSQHYQCQFVIDGIEYSCAEQYMMHQKAVVFEDWYHAQKILGTSNPGEMKKLGRQVRNFCPRFWDQSSSDIVKYGNRAKFTQNEGLMAVLFSTYPRILVESSPRDRLWGIGVGRENPLASSRRTWRGKNRLGYILTELRNELMEEKFLLEYK